MKTVETTTSTLTNWEQKFIPMPGLFLYEQGEFSSPIDFVGFPARVRNRMFLHAIGACGMFAAIVRPEVDLCQSDFALLRTKADEVNEQIGLEVPVSDLVIRTRYVHPSDNESGYNPMLFISRAGQKNQLMYTNSERGLKIVDSVSRWKAHFWKAPMYMMVHEENPIAQKASVHGRVMYKTVDQSWEIEMGTGVLHARLIGKTGTPYARASGHDLRWIIESLANNRPTSLLCASSPDHAYTLARRIESSVEPIMEIVRVVRRSPSANTVLEFRVYPHGRMFGYDTDDRFNAETGSNDISKLKWGDGSFQEDMQNRGLGRD